MRAIERRAYLRVPDNLHVEHVVVSAEEYKKSTVTEVLDLPGAFDLRRELYRLELEARDLTREIAENDRKMGSYFHNLNQRIELLQRQSCSIKKTVTLQRTQSTSARPVRPT